MGKGTFIKKQYLLDELQNQIEVVTKEGTFEAMLVVDARDLIEMAPTVEALPIDWIHRRLTRYVCEHRFSSADLPLVFTLISDWRKECEKDETA